MRILVAIALSLAIATSASAMMFVEDNENLLTPDQRAQLTQQLTSIQSRTGTVVVARTTPNLTSTIGDYAYNIRKLIEQDYPRVVVMAVSWNNRKAYIGTSESARYQLPDGVVEQIFKGTMTPPLKSRDIFGAFSASARDINTRLPDTTVVNVPNSVTTFPKDTAVQSNTTSDGSFLTFLFVMLGFAMFVSVLGYAIVQNRRRREAAWRESRDYAESLSTSARRPSSRYNSRNYVSPVSTPPSNNTVFAPIVVSNTSTTVNEDRWAPSAPVHVPDPVPTVYPDPTPRSDGGGYGGSIDSSPSSSSSSSSSDWGSGGGSGGGFDSGGGFGGGFDGGGGAGGDF